MSSCQPDSAAGCQPAGLRLFARLAARGAESAKLADIRGELNLAQKETADRFPVHGFSTPTMYHLVRYVRCLPHQEFFRQALDVEQPAPFLFLRD